MKKARNILISLFVIAWIIVFHYESTRFFFLQPFLKKPLPKVMFLFPPAGWIMFYNVDDAFGYVEVYGVKGNVPYRIDPHEIIETRTIMYDNIHRNILSTVADQRVGRNFCAMLRRKFPYFDEFLVTSVYYPSLIKGRYERYQQVKYRCVD